MTMTKDVEQLIARLQGNDVEALSELYDRYANKMFVIAIKILQNKVDAEDLLHDVFLEVKNKAKDYDPARGNLLTWLSMITKYRALDRLRNLRLARGRYTQATGASEPSWEPDNLTGIDIGLVEKAIGKLTEKQKQMLDLGYRRGLTYLEIARQCDVPVGTVKSRMNSAVSHLRRLLVPSAEAKL